MREDLVPRLALERRTITEALNPMSFKVRLPSIVQWKTARLDGSMPPFPSLVRTPQHGEYPASLRVSSGGTALSHAKIFLSRWTSSMVSASAFLSVSFSSLRRSTSTLVASRLVSTVHPSFPASRKAFNQLIVKRRRDPLPPAQVRDGNLPSQTLKHNTNLVISPEFPPGSSPDLCNHIPGHVSSFLFLAQANYPEPTGTSRSLMVESQRPKLSTNKIPFRFPFSLTLNI